MRRKVQVFSPHFDDASLSCGEHILSWLAAGFDVEVYTIFSQFESEYLSQDSQDFMRRSGSTAVQTFQHERSQEDSGSMKLLGVKNYYWLGLTDGGFRSDRHKPVYSSHKELFSGIIADPPAWQAKLHKELQSVVHKDAEVVFPLGVGHHADHLLVRNMLREIVPEAQQHCYVDVPYAFVASSWDLSQISRLLTLPKSLMWSSAQKLKAVEAYTSQVPTLFYDEIWPYPECVIGQAIQ